MRHFVGLLLTTDAQGNPPYPASLALCLLAFWALQRDLSSPSCATVRQVSGRQPVQPFGLASLGAVVLVAAFVVSRYGVLPIVRRIVWPPVREVYGVADWWEFETSVGPLEELLAGTATAGLLVFAAGWLIKRVRAIARRDGYWVANPVSIVIASAIWAWLFAAGRTEIEQWTGTVWGLRTIVACPAYAALFRAGAALSDARGGPTRG